MTAASISLTRRGMLAGGGALIIGVTLPLGSALAREGFGPTGPSKNADPNAFVKIAPDNTVTLMIKPFESGQGVRAGMAALMAEELDADWAHIRAESAPAAPAYYHTWLGQQTVGASSSLAESFIQLRKVGAAARAMLVAAAAREWGVDAAQISVENGVISHPPSQRTGSFGQFAAVAAQMPVPSDPPLKARSQFRIIGKDKAVGRPDTLAKTNGTAVYGIDVVMPDMLYVVVAHPPRFGAKLASFDAAPALKVRGVVAVRQLSSGIAVYGKNTWAAIKGRAALIVKWDESGAESRSCKQIAADYLAASKKPGLISRAKGDVDAALAAAGDDLVEVEYVFPYLAHAPMEPYSGALVWNGERVDVRYGCQAQTVDQAAIAKVFGLEPHQVDLTTTFAGGSFGRRSPADSEFAVELAEAAKAIGKNQPVKLTRTREDDITGGYYRPLMVHRMKGALKDGKITAWSDSIVGQTLFMGTIYHNLTFENGIDNAMVEGARSIFYDVPNFRCDVTAMKTAVPALWWRSVGSNHTGFAVESFVDILLEKAGKDPVSGRIEIMTHTSSAERAVAALKAVADLAKWQGPGPVNGRARGVAVTDCFGTVVAQIAEVSLDKSGEPKVHKIWAAVDCGIAVTPDVVRAQVEGGIGFALGHILYAEVTIEAGQAQVSNFDRYRALRINEMPEIEVVIIPSERAPTGIGEPPVPACGPAVSNALARLLKTRPTHLPIVKVT